MNAETHFLTWAASLIHVKSEMAPSQQMCVVTYFMVELGSADTGLDLSATSMLSAMPPEAEKLPYSTLHLPTNSSFAELNCRKLDRLGVRCFRLGRLGCRVILPGENNITACVKDTWRQLCSTSAVKVWNLGGWTQFYLFLCPRKQPYAFISQSYFES